MSSRGCWEFLYFKSRLNDKFVVASQHFRSWCAVIVVMTPWNYFSCEMCDDWPSPGVCGMVRWCLVQSHAQMVRVAGMEVTLRQHSGVDALPPETTSCV